MTRPDLSISPAAELDALLKEMDCGYMLLSIKDGASDWSIIYCNDSFRVIMGTGPCTADMTLKSLLPGSDAPVTALLEPLVHGVPRVSENIHLADSDRMLNAVAYRLNDAHAALVVHDLTEKEKMSHDLVERSKELSCLIQVSHLVETPGIGLEDILVGTAELIPSSFHHPEHTGALLTYDEFVYSTSLYNENQPLLSVDIHVFGTSRGSIKVSCNPPVKNDNIFLREEHVLVDALAARIGRVIERITDQGKVHELSHMLIDSQETERKQVACDLHDGPLQTILVSKINVAEYLKRSGKEDPLLVKGIELIDSALSEIRSLCDNLYPSILENIGVEAAINRYCDQFLAPNGIEVNKSINVPGNLPMYYNMILYRLSQELFSNVLKHSGADTVDYHLDVVIMNDMPSVTLQVRDNGLGFDQKPGGKGLRYQSIRFRAESLGGKVHVDSTEGEGTTVTITNRDAHEPG